MENKEQIKWESTLTLTNKITELTRMEAFVEEMGEALLMDMGSVMQLNLALEEAVTNVINYAYPDAEGDISINAQATDTTLTIRIEDRGIAFDPTAHEDPDITLGVEEREIGGLGIFMVRNIMDTVRYERADGRNILTLTKHLKAM